MQATTSISVDPLTLKWVNAVRSFFEYKWGRRVTMNETVLQMAGFLDYVLQMQITGESAAKKIGDFQEFVRRRIDEFGMDLTAEEVEQVWQSLPFSQLTEEKRPILFNADKVPKRRS